MPTALITGITGQDGRFLAEFLHSKGYTIYGLLHGQNNPKTELVQRDHPYVELVTGDLLDLSSLIAVLVTANPDEVYNLAAISFVPLTFNQPELTANVNGTGVLRMLEAIRIVERNAQDPDSLLPGQLLGDVRQRSRDAADGIHSVLPAVAVWLRQSVRPPHHGQLPRELRLVRLLGNLVQPRKRAPWARIRFPQDHQRGGAGSNLGSRQNSCWETSSRAVIGVTPATT